MKTFDRILNIALVVVFTVAALVLLTAQFYEEDEFQEEPHLTVNWNEPFLEMCTEFTYTYDEIGETGCPEGFGRVVVETPTSERKPWCRVSLGAVFDCGRIVEP